VLTYKPDCCGVNEFGDWFYIKASEGELQGLSKGKSVHVVHVICEGSEAALREDIIMFDPALDGGSDFGCASHAQQVKQGSPEKHLDVTRLNFQQLLMRISMRMHTGAFAD
jgi:hypothetical protein